MKRLKETEFDKLSYELLEKVYPTKALNSYYFLGIAETLSVLTTIIDMYMEKDINKLNAETMKELILDYAKHNPEVAEYYERLKNDNNN